MKKLMLATVAFSALALGSAQAVPYNDTFNVIVWQGNSGANGNAANAQANLTNPLFGTANIANFTFTGNLAFNVGAAQPNTFGNFFGNGGTISGFGSGTGLSQAAFLATLMSTANFQTTSLLQFTDTYTGSLSGTITHDDGASLYYGPGNTVSFESAAPTNSIPNAYTLPGTANSFRLVYVEANGAPSVLNFDVANRTTVPEPMSLALLGVGLIGAGLVRRRSA